MKRKKEQNSNNGYKVLVERQGWKELKMKCFKAFGYVQERGEQ